jgi:plasmid stabilization system protein ParE
MSKYVLAPAAEDDLLTIWHYYAEEVKDPDLADRMIGEIISGLHTVAWARRSKAERKGRVKNL